MTWPLKQHPVLDLPYNYFSSSDQSLRQCLFIWVKWNEWLENYVEINSSVNQYEQELGLSQQL